MFNIVTPVLNFNDTLYILKRTIKESTIPEDQVQDYKNYLGCDAVLKKNGMYFFVNKIEEIQLIDEEKPLELDLPKES